MTRPSGPGPQDRQWAPTGHTEVSGFRAGMRWLGQKDIQQSSGCRDRADMGALGFLM